jgi:hypothetical protein
VVWIGRVATTTMSVSVSHATQHHFGRLLSQCSNTGGILQSGSVVYFLSFKVSILFLIQDVAVSPSSVVTSLRRASCV